MSGESLNAVTRMHQHSATPEKQGFETVRVILDDTFNKSVCLALESSLIRWFAGDGAFRVRNRNIGICDAEYYDRKTYQRRFKAIFDQLRDQGLFGHSIPEIENSDLFKLSPYKALTDIRPQRSSRFWMRCLMICALASAAPRSCRETLARARPSSRSI